MRREIAVVGGGLSGFAAALGFAEKGFDTVLLAPPAPADARSTALIGTSIDVLTATGVWPLIEPKAQPLVAMRIVDDTGRLLRAPTVEFRASEVERAQFGANALNADIRDALTTAAADFPDRLEIIEEALSDIAIEDDGALLRTSGGKEIRASLVVGADGRNSAVRRGAGIEMRRWSYPQSAIVLNFRHEQDHGAASTEFHTANGPITQVPLPGRRSSLVWVAEPAVAELVPDLRLERLSALVEEKLHSFLGAVRVEEGVQVFPLSGGRVERLTGPRIALIGEAAHVFPPIGAQGLNLGLRDGADLVEAALSARDDPGGHTALARYERARRLDIASRSGAVDLLNRSLLSTLLPAQIARTAGLGALSAIGPLRRFAMREGIAPGSGLRSLMERKSERIAGRGLRRFTGRRDPA